MAKADLTAAVGGHYKATFGTDPEALAHAPGRVNLLGEHTDYNGGFVLPMPLVLGTAVALGQGGAPGTLAVTSATFDGVETRSLDEAATGSWTDYVLGSVLQVLADRRPETGLRLAITTDLPVGSGLSSSAAVEIATMRAANEIFDLGLSAVDMAKLARKAENDFVGMPCGIMDQYSVSVGEPGSAVFLDTRSLVSTVTATPDSHNFVVIHSGVTHKLTDDGYAQRVRECAAACAEMCVEILSDLTLDDLDRIATLPDPLDKRAKHIVTENDRVRRGALALSDGDTATFARLMVESHRSQRDDYAVSVPEVDALVDGALAAGADGARLTGGGFGGSVVAFVAADRVDAFCASIEQGFPAARVIAVT